ncbi:transforming acidic coiled-coil-containing protein 3-like [Uloborus diversus]|uniref:transforming acidic coiled-coil-containing protein 3-like n=1 Tax=Uloborus diversus TaxID=327109 RepID=UPI0024094292|nr:transforming acidic coiled-coil-containing protein 3-like [Uloborus diversus]
MNLLDSTEIFSTNNPSKDIPNVNIAGNKNLLDSTSVSLGTHSEIFSDFSNSNARNDVPDDNVAGNENLLDSTDVGLNTHCEIFPEFSSNNTRNNIPDSNIAGHKNLLDSTDIGSTQGEIFSDFPSNENANLLKDDEFHDAVQFFKDPSSMSFLENAGSSKVAIENNVARSSLYVNFDPLHEKFSNQCSNKSNKLGFILETAQESDTIVENERNVINEEVNTDIDAAKKEEIVNKPLANISVRESLGNVLISFDSPVVRNHTSAVPEPDPVTLYSEEELQQRLKMQELSLQEGFLIRQREIEQESLKKLEEMEQQKNNLSKLCVAFHASLTEMSVMALNFSEKLKTLEAENNDLEIENKKIKEDLKVSTSDFQSLESTFSDFHKRYEQCKNMLKVYKDNEDCLKQQVLTIQMELQEKEKKYQLLQSRAEEMLQKANTDLANAKKVSDAQAAVLKAQLKKAELKISSLESDYKQIKIENSKLGGICDDLMAKVSET